MYSVPHLAVFTILWALVQVGYALGSPGVLTGTQIDTDGYMRLVRLGVLLDGGGWYDGTIPRSNWPFGEVHHWTRPLDALLVAIMLPFAAFLQTDTAVAIAGAIVSPLCHLALCIAALWVVQPLVPGPSRHYAMPAMLAQPGLIAYGTVGRADHHMLIFLLAALAMGAWMRALICPSSRKWGLAAGILSAVGIWVSPESLLPLALIFLSGGIAWVLRGPRMIVPNLHLCAGLAGALAVAIVLERPPTEWLWQEFDRISFAHLTVSLLAAAFWWAVRSLHRTEDGARASALEHRSTEATNEGSGMGAPQGPAASGWQRRLTYGMVGAVLASGLLAAIHPRFFHGPWEAVDPEIIAIWLSRVQELQPLLPEDRAGFGRFMVYFGPVLFLLPAAVVWLWRDRSDTRVTARAFLLAALLVYVPLAAYQARFSGYVGLVAAILMMDLIARLLERADAIASPLRRSGTRVAAILGILMSPLIMGEAAGALASAGGSITSRENGEDPSAGPCRLDGISVFLSDPAGLGSEPRTIAAFIDFGPELLYRTPHRILAGPYHRNADGIMAAYRMLTALDPALADSIVRARQVNLVLICPPRDSAYFGRQAGPSVYTGLVHGTPPQSMHEIALPDHIPDGFRLFQVR
jgi:hypothetical protein